MTGWQRGGFSRGLRKPAAGHRHLFGIGGNPPKVEEIEAELARELRSTSKSRGKRS